MNKVKNDPMKAKVNLEKDLTDIVQERKLIWYGHLIPHGTSKWALRRRKREDLAKDGAMI